MDHLKQLASRYETVEFLKDDPSQFMHLYSNPADQEIVALLSALLAFGKRSEILVHVRKIIDCVNACKMTPQQWIVTEKYKDFFPDEAVSFYRVFSSRQLRLLCGGLREILHSHGTLGACLKMEVASLGPEGFRGVTLAGLLASHFPDECSPLVSKGKDSANKRLNLFLRWMVRQNSPVDLGIWEWFPCQQLIMPLDVHVIQMAQKFKLLPPHAGANAGNARALTEKMRLVFPDDPLKGDFALFGLGVAGG